MSKLSQNQRRHLMRIVEEPGTVRSGVCMGKGWNARTFASLRKRGLIRSNERTGWMYHPTSAGLAEVACHGCGEAKPDVTTCTVTFEDGRTEPVDYCAACLDYGQSPASENRIASYVEG